MPIERVGQILSGFQSIQNVAGSRSGFEAVLAAARGGGPHLELENDPAAEVVLAGGDPRSIRTEDRPGVPAAVDPGWASKLPESGRSWAEEITAAARANGIDERLLAALVWSESAFNPDAVSTAGAVGLAQLMPGTAAGLGVDPEVPAQNLDGGARYLRQQLDRFGSVDLALAAYNAGPGRVIDAGNRIPGISETQAYVRVVTDRYSRLGGSP